jgi:predicted metal-dependent hydrolase
LNFCQPSTSTSDFLQVGSRQVPVHWAANRRARRYVLRLQGDGSARVTIPRGGSIVEGRRFAEGHVGWLERQLARQADRPKLPTTWTAGSEILFRGVPVRLEEEEGGIRFAGQRLKAGASAGDWRPGLERYLWRLAALELPGRVMELAALHGFPVRRVSVRNQRSRWGSCSRRGTVSLNWRLVQIPEWVRDYIILHELAHFGQMNHSSEFWSEVARLCPDWREAERWLKQHGSLLARV